LNSSGQLGDGVKDHGYVDPDGYDVSPAPVRVSGITNATQVSVGGSVACAVLSGGSVECWGSGDQLGNGAETDSSTPVRVSGITSAIQVSVGSGSTCAVLSDHTVFCWGDGGYGQLGNGTTASSATPVRVGGITSATQVSRGDFDGHTCAVLSGGTVSCWGANWFGQLGDGVIDHGHKDSAGNDFSSTPVKVSGITNATEVSVGSSGSCAILSGGSVECWGLGSTGALGDGVSDHGHRDPNGRDFSPTPVSVVGLT
jgi:alpha-tubulin suppressor-like RCC1 family protein